MAASSTRDLKLECLKYAVAAYAQVKEGQSAAGRKDAILACAKTFHDWICEPPKETGR